MMLAEIRDKRMENIGNRSRGVETKRKSDNEKKINLEKSLDQGPFRRETGIRVERRIQQTAGIAKRRVIQQTTGIEKRDEVL